MSNSNLASMFIPAKWYTKGRDGRHIEMITIHHMACIYSAEQCGKSFQGTKKASSHYGVGVYGEIGQYVDECNTAWANANWDSNCKAVTIETSNDEVGGEWHVSDTTLHSLIKLVADIAKRNNLGKLVRGKNLTWHSMYAATACPGKYLLSKIDYIIAEANKINEYEEPKKEEEFEVAKVYKNGSSVEICYKDSDFKTKTGSLDKWEQCECLGYVKNSKNQYAYIVKYKINNTNSYAVGFVKYNGKVQI